MLRDTRTVFEDPFSESVWRDTYKDHTDQTVDDTMRRVARFVASAEDTDKKRTVWENLFFDALTGFKITAGGRIYSNAGTEWSGTTLLNCFVSPRGDYDIDSLKSIMHDLYCQVQTLKSEGGWGENFSYIRPRGSFIHGIGVESPGSVKYMEMFDRTSDVITSGSGVRSQNKKAKGKIRKGAMMGVLNVDHPDIIEFITAKQQPGRLTKFNVSVNCTNDFMDKVIRVMDMKKALETNTPLPDTNKVPTQEQIDEEDKWNLCFPVTTHRRYKTQWQGSLRDWVSKKLPVQVYKTVSATWLWDLIMESTYNRAEPGVLFLDRANYFNPLNYKETIHSTNPCIAGNALITLADNTQITMQALVHHVESGRQLVVKTYNIEKGIVEYEAISCASLTRRDAEVLQITLEDGKTLKLTPDHKVYTTNRGYVEARELTVDDDLVVL